MISKTQLLFVLVIIALVSCQTNTDKPVDTDLEAREDSLALIKAYSLQSEIPLLVSADVETSAINANNMDDAADDPAVWINPNQASESLIYGSNKKGGIAVYDLSGKETDYYAQGKINNIDVLYDFPLDGKNITLLGCSNRTDQSVDLFKIDSIGRLIEFESSSFSVDTALIDDIYGFCFGKDKDENPFVFYNGKNGVFIQQAILTLDDSIYLKTVKTVRFDDQTEGMVVDNEMGNVYIGAENSGVYVLDVSSEDTSAELLEMTRAEINTSLAYDLEGITIYKDEERSWLIISSQGNFSYAVYDIEEKHKYLFSFKILGDKNIDGVEETDGLEAISDSLSISFPKGVLVVQDGFNYSGDSLTSQNFKLIDFRKIIQLQI